MIRGTRGNRPWAVLAGLTVPVALLGGLTWAPRLLPVRTAIDPVTRIGHLEAEAAASPAAAPLVSAAASTAPGLQASSLPTPDSRWVARTAQRTGIGPRALTAYAAAELRAAATDPPCHLSWATLAGIGWVESQHGTIGGRVLDPTGRPAITPIIGVRLTGAGPVAQVADSDHGRVDGDPRFDRAVGPLQFLPSTWRTWGSDGDGDGVVDPQDIDDAAWSAARYLCAGGDRLDTPAGWTRAVLSYNESDVYVTDVVAATNTYASRARD